MDLDFEPITFGIIGLSCIIGAILYIILGCDIYGTISLSIGIAFITLGIAKQSSRMMKKIAYASFEETGRYMQHRRLEMRGKLEAFMNKANTGYYTINQSQYLPDKDEYIRFHSYSVWLCYNYLKSGMNFKEYLRDSDKEMLVHQIENVFTDLLNGKQYFQIGYSNEYKNHIENMFNIVSEFEAFDRDPNRRRRMRVSLGLLII
ncbi:hypothetical protein MBGDF03_00516 [Thermoplasmatales archaeon SCGC AB-540-F20]|nr:hypothetical protein MBGDF03_00516 [Thermoplasmatales archaeon SCGC AB-540-F20]